MVKMIVEKQNIIEPTIIALATYNPDIGDWVLEQLLNLNRAKCVVNLIEEISLSDEPKIIGRVIKIYDFIMSEIRRASALP